MTEFNVSPCGIDRSSNCSPSKIFLYLERAVFEITILEPSPVENPLNFGRCFVDESVNTKGVV